MRIESLSHALSSMIAFLGRYGCTVEGYAPVDVQPMFRLEGRRWKRFFSRPLLCAHFCMPLGYRLGYRGSGSRCLFRRYPTVCMLVRSQRVPPLFVSSAGLACWNCRLSRRRYQIQLGRREVYHGARRWVQVRCRRLLRRRVVPRHPGSRIWG